MPLHDLQCGAGFMLLKVLTYVIRQHARLQRLGRRMLCYLTRKGFECASQLELNLSEVQSLLLLESIPSRKTSVSSRYPLQVQGMVLSTKDKKTCACLMPPEAFADKENCCSPGVCTAAEVQAMYQLPTGQQRILAWYMLHVYCTLCRH